MLKNVLHVAGSGSAFNTLANAILILKVNGIHAVCKPPEPDVYDVPHCIYPIANQKTFASLLVKLVLKIAAVDDMLPPKTIILTLVSVP